MNRPLDLKRIGSYLAFAFGISWTTALIIYLRGGIHDSPIIIPAIGYTEALLLIATTYMFAPAIAHVLTRLVTREGWRDTGLRPNFKRGRRYWLLAWLGTLVLILLGAAVFFTIFPRHFDTNLAQVVANIGTLEEQTGQPFPLPPSAFLIVLIIQSMTVALLFNFIPILGEEFGWRGYLQPKLMPLGARKAILWTGLIWGVWHWPLITMGHAYGSEYVGAPWLGLLTFAWFTFVLGTFLGWLTLRSGSIWPAVIGHTVTNVIVLGIVPLILVGSPNPLFGPSPAGLLGGIGFSIVALRLLLGRGLYLEAEESPSESLEAVPEGTHA